MKFSPVLIVILLLILIALHLFRWNLAAGLRVRLRLRLRARTLPVSILVGPRSPHREMIVTLRTMELREFAERVLFATSLEEKLQPPDGVTDEQPGPAIVAPAAPGRPRELNFKPTGSARGEFPGTRHLEQDSERGRLLHFFANHELLATELMALVLLKFPDAPTAFRKGVFETLKDEQEHTRLYMERMRGCGIEFGSIPVSGYFWRAVSGMESPLDYVAGLSLTFEQANLDFARHYSSCFGEVGDAASARLLDKIYRDEIGHVAYGLKWFRRWKNPGESDWEAFCRQLKYPLSPQRAKGLLLNVAGRQAAGLDAAFIAELDVYSQSKGRTPGVFLFNPFTEARMAQGRTFNPTKHQAQLARDLESLPQFLGRQDDLVLVERRPSVEFLSGLKQAGFALPEFVEMKQPLTRPAATLCPSDGERDGVRGVFGLAQRKLGRLRPWAWGPDSVELFQPLFANLTGEQRTANGSFNPEIAQLYSKAWSAALLRKFLQLSRTGGALPSVRRAPGDEAHPAHARGAPFSDRHPESVAGFLRNAARYSTLPSAPVIGDGTTPRDTRPSAAAETSTRATARARTASSRTIPPRPTSRRSASNCGLTRTRTSAEGARSGTAAGRTRVSEMKERSPTRSEGSSGTSARERRRALTFSLRTTRGSPRSFAWSCPHPTSTA